MSTFKPSEVVLREVPLVGTMNKAEVEFAAALIVHTLAVRGDTWRPVKWSEIQEVMRAHLDAKEAPWYLLLTNPFLRPDVHLLVERGYAAWEGEVGGPVAFTDAGRAAMARWMRPPAHGLVPDPRKGPTP